MNHERTAASWAAPLVAMVTFIGAWALVVRTFSISPLILPSPGAVATRSMEQASYLAYHAGVTLLEAALGFVLGGAVALGLAVLFYYSRALERALYPYTIALKALPLVTLAPLAVVWFGGGIASKVVLAAVISFFPILVNTLDGLRSVGPEFNDLMHSLSATPTQTLRMVAFPHALPSIFSGLKVASTFAVVGAVVAEFVSAQSGIGYVVKSSSYYLDTDLTFAAIAVASLVGLAFFFGVRIVERRVLFWAPDRLERD